MAGWLLSDEAGEPRLHPFEASAKALRLAVPPDITRLMAEQPELALRWRLALREALLSALSQGFQATRFMAGSYLLVRSD